MNKFELYKNMYHYELDTKEKINSRISSPIAIMTLFIGGFGYFIKYISKIEKVPKPYIYYLLLIIYTVILILIIIFTLLIFFKYSYKYFPARDVWDFDLEVEKYYDDNYEKYFSECGIEKSELKEKYFCKKLSFRYVEAAEFNMALNEKKLGYFRKIGWISVIGLICAVSIFMFLVFNKIF